jgi:aspartyl protease family protein
MSEDEYDDTRKIGRVFVWIAWLLGIGMLVFVFQDILDEQHNPNASPDLYLNQAGKSEVHLKQNRYGHYVTGGRINEQAVTFLLDTGATEVSIPSHIAEQLNLPVLGNYPVQTANGTVKVYQTRLEQLSIGNIFLYNVSAHINPGMQSDQILLGMSALRKIEFSQTGKQLILREP